MPDYVPTWGVVAPTSVASNILLAGTSLQQSDYTDSIFIVNDPANGPGGLLHDNDLIGTNPEIDTTVSEPNEGFADSDGGPIIAIEELGVFNDSVVTLAGGATLVVPMYAFRLTDGRTILRVHDFELAGFNNAGFALEDIQDITLGSATNYEALTSVESFRFDLPFAMICFADGSMIDTKDGPIAVEDLTPGRLVRTLDHGCQPLRLALARTVTVEMQRRNDRLRPVHISAGALGNGFPACDLRVSRQHRMLVSSPICQRMFGKSEVLIPAIRLTDLPGIYVDESCAQVSYFHLVFDDHEVIFANGTPSESFFIGEQALKTLSREARQELLTLFPDAVERAKCAVPARHVPSGSRSRGLIARHAKSGKPLLQKIG
ncbi:Hint domain-containing protein [Paracoccus sp. Z330]|uniref:Hint domain-containing protein n=1 Tax=Paracoccus onchidii TaxID=3017813 RepID=A0ABT4ZJI6_9RHOB|nr:Hint domain-containing protein [Paracoccus onchidii]MDB6178890.1 Hint domain-containing protein [Paracoccus onchidii]